MAFTMGMESQYTIRDAVANADRMDRAVWEALITHLRGNLDILASPADIAYDDPHMESLLKVIRFAARQYRWIVMDLGRVNRRSKLLLGSADDLIVVTTKSIPALHQCKHAIEMVRDLGIDHKRIRLILNQKQDGERLSGREIENMFGVPIEATLPPSHEDLHDAYIKRRLPSVTGSFRLALTAMACKMAGLPDQTPKRSLLSLTGLRERFHQKVKESEESIAS
jgi:Flp pilus assembly CpaE family ATPase